MTIVESQAAGRPVVAADGGGAQETVLPGRTGVLVPTGQPRALAEALSETDFGGFEVDALTSNAARFSAEAFCRRLTGEVDRLTGAVPA